VWSQPDEDIKGWREQDEDYSYDFWCDVVEKFCENFEIELIIRTRVLKF